MRRLRWAWAAAAVVGTAPAMMAQDAPIVPAAGSECLPPVRLHHRPPAPRPMPYTPVLPVDPTRPVDPGQPVDPKRPTDPTRPPDPTAPSPAPTARAPEAGTQPAATLNPNMFGDQFGGSATETQLFNARTVQFVLSGTASSPGRVIILPQSNPPLQYSGASGSTQFRPPFAGVVVLEDSGRSTSFTAPVIDSATVVTTGQTVYSVQENPDVTSAVRRLNPGASVFYLSPLSTAVLQNAISPGFGFYNINQGYQINTPLSFGLVIPSPAGGGVVGRTKLSDDNSPIPRDRLILGGDFYGGAALTRDGFDVSRVSPGIEYTFFDRWTSVEVRAPFASTLDPNLSLNGAGGRAAEFGNVNVVLKGLLVRGNEFNLATGLGISLPTGPDVQVAGSDGSNLLRITNDSFLFTPYLAALYTPGERFFAQVWGQVSVDPTGSRVFAGDEQFGRLYDQTFFAADLQVGYWFIKNGPESTLRGLAPFIELHYNTPISDAGSVTANALTIGSQNNRYDEWNLTLGASAQFGTNLLVNAGLVIPIGGGNNEFFDYQFGLRANWFFGPTAEARFRADATGGRIEPVGNGGSAMPGGGRAGAAGGGAAAPADEGALARAPEAGTQPAGTLNPNFFGDFIGVNARTGGQSRYAQLPIAPRYNGLKLADGDSPRPADRAYYNFNRYSDAAGAVNPPGLPELRLTRQIVGVETTLGDNASLGLRLPFLHLDGDPASELREVGDLTVTGKYALYNDRSTGDVFSLGLSVTLPTGGRGPSVLADGTAPPRAAFFQPWAGGAWSYGDTFVQSVAAVVLPAEAIYPAAFFASAGGGYWVYRNESDALVRGIAPVAELHFNMPITNRREDSQITFNDQVNLTTGVYFQLPKMTIGGAVCIPLSGPRPYDLEAMLSVNYQF